MLFTCAIVSDAILLTVGVCVRLARVSIKVVVADWAIKCKLHFSERTLIQINRLSAAFSWWIKNNCVHTEMKLIHWNGWRRRQKCLVDLIEDKWDGWAPRLRIITGGGRKRVGRNSSPCWIVYKSIKLKLTKTSEHISWKRYFFRMARNAGAN